MRLFLTVSAGDRADQTRPIMAISDQSLIRDLLHSIARLGDESARQSDSGHPTAPALHVVAREGVGAGAEPVAIR